MLYEECGIYRGTPSPTVKGNVLDGDRYAHVVLVVCYVYLYGNERCDDASFSTCSVEWRPTETAASQIFYVGLDEVSSPCSATGGMTASLKTAKLDGISSRTGK